MSIRRDLDKRAFQLILESGDEGVLQSEMWRRLGISDKYGSRIARGLEEKGVIKRQRELHEGRWTYRLISLKKQITIDSINDCPCMPCENIEKCDPGLFASPILCEKFTNWLNAKTNVEISLEESNDKNV